MNFRFWTYWNGTWSKLTVRPGRRLYLKTGGAHEEGWSSHAEEFHHAGNGVVRHWCSDGTDCDGRLTRTGVDFAHGVELVAIPLSKTQGEPYWDRTQDYNTAADYHKGRLIHRPEWTSMKERVYDRVAEAAGY